MRILVTNDDGIDSVGLHVLARRLAPLGDVVIVAPDQEYSGFGAALGTLHPMQPEVHRVQVYGRRRGLDGVGPPCAVRLLRPAEAFGDVDLVVSGINPGVNTGRAIYHSGTVGAALTARNGGIPGIAVSQSVVGFGVEGQGWDEMLEGQLWDTAAEVAAGRGRGRHGRARRCSAAGRQPQRAQLPGRCHRRLAARRGGNGPAPDDRLGPPRTQEPVTRTPSA